MSSDSNSHRRPLSIPLALLSLLVLPGIALADAPPPLPDAYTWTSQEALGDIRTFMNNAGQVGGAFASLGGTGIGFFDGETLHPYRLNLTSGEDTGLVAFNIGVELGQLAIVAVILLIAYLALSMLRAPRREWTLFLSGGAFSLALVMALERV